METIIKPERRITPEIEREFRALFESNADSGVLVNFADSRLVHPGLPHFMLHQQIWIRDAMGPDKKDQVAFSSTFKEYERELFRINYESYVVKYVSPVFCNTNRNRDYLLWPDDEKNWVDSVLDKVAMFVQIDKATLLSRIAEKDKDLARRLEEEGFVAHCIPDDELVLCGSSSDSADSFHSDYY